MDPRHRMLLECTYEALENSGIPMNSIIGSDVGVYVGGSLYLYEFHCLRDFETAPRLQFTVRGARTRFLRTEFLTFSTFEDRAQPSIRLAHLA